MDTTWSQFSVAVENEPSSGAARRLLDRIINAALGILRRGSRSDLQSMTRRADRFARAFAPAPDAKGEIWQSWYAGQAHVLAGLCRIALADALSNEVMRVIRSRAHAQRVLTALRHRQLGISALASELGIDVSQLAKLIDKLEEHGVVETHKEDRTRWVMLTALGERAAMFDSELPVPNEEMFGLDIAAVAEAGEISPATINELASLMEKVNEKMEVVTKNRDALERLAHINQNYTDLAQKLQSAAEQASRVSPDIPFAEPAIQRQIQT